MMIIGPVVVLVVAEVVEADVVVADDGSNEEHREHERQPEWKDREHHRQYTCSVDRLPPR